MKVDRIAPQLSVLPIAKYSLISNTYPIKGTAEDNVTVFVNNQAGVATNRELAVILPLQNGVNKYTIYLQDNAGNKSEMIEGEINAFINSKYQKMSCWKFDVVLPKGKFAGNCDPNKNLQSLWIYRKTAPYPTDTILAEITTFPSYEKLKQYRLNESCYGGKPGKLISESNYKTAFGLDAKRFKARIDCASDGQYLREYYVLEYDSVYYEFHYSLSKTAYSSTKVLAEWEKDLKTIVDYLIFK